MFPPCFPAKMGKLNGFPGIPRYATAPGRDPEPQLGPFEAKGWRPAAEVANLGRFTGQIFE
jgi:hypothetical protein